MAVYADSLAVRERFLGRLANLEDDATQSLIRAYAVTIERIEADITRSLATDSPLGRALADSFDGAEDTARVAILRGRAAFILDEMDRFARNGASAVRILAPQAYRLGIDEARDQVSEIAGSFTRPNRRQIEQTVARLQQGTSLAGYFDEFATSSAQKAMDQMVSSVVLGQGPDEIVRGLRDKLGVGEARLKTMVRTEVLGAARSGIADSYRANADVVKGWIWNAFPSPTTCEVCWAMNGTLHDLDEDLHSHPNCRCVQTPMTRTFDEIAADYGLGPTGATETRLESFDPDERFDAALSEAEKIRVLGPGKYALYRDGQIRLADLVTPTFSEKWGPGLRATTLRELRERGVSPASVVDQVAAGAARAVAAPTPTVRVPILDAISSLFDTPKMTAKVRARVGDTLDAINVLHGVRSDVTWNAARTRKVGRREIRESVEPRGSIPIELRAASSRGEGGHFASFHDVDEILPLRIVLRPSTGGPMMNYETVLAHELGHYIDYNLMPRIAKGTSSNAVIGHRIAVGSLDDFGRRLIDDDRLAEAMGDVFRAVYDTETWAAILRIESRAYRDYFADPKEVFARVYAQWVSERAGTPAMRDELRRAQAWPRSDGRAAGLDVFTPEEFERIGAAMDELFRTAGMLR